MQPTSTAWTQPLRARIAVLLCVLTACLPAFARSASLCLCSGTVRVEASCCAAGHGDLAERAVASCCGEPRASCCSQSLSHGQNHGEGGDEDNRDDDAPCCRDVSLEDEPTVPVADRLSLADGENDGDSAGVEGNWAAAVRPVPQQADRHAPATGPPAWDPGMRRRQRERASVLLLI